LVARRPRRTARVGSRMQPRAERYGAAGMSLADQSCVPCRGGVPPLTRDQLAPLLGRSRSGTLVEAGGRPHHLRREFRFPDFKTRWPSSTRSARSRGQATTPDIELGWGRWRSRSTPTRSTGWPRPTASWPPASDRIHAPLESPDEAPAPPLRRPGHARLAHHAGRGPGRGARGGRS
jgi:4a-hydroxytetrahydrobiopterin dehydratase